MHVCLHPPPQGKYTLTWIEIARQNCPLSSIPTYSLDTSIYPLFAVDFPQWFRDPLQNVAYNAFWRPVRWLHQSFVCRRGKISVGSRSVVFFSLLKLGKFVKYLIKKKLNSKGKSSIKNTTGKKHIKMKKSKIDYFSILFRACRENFLTLIFRSPTTFFGIEQERFNHWWFYGKKASPPSAVS